MPSVADCVRVRGAPQGVAFSKRAWDRWWWWAAVRMDTVCEILQWALGVCVILPVAQAPCVILRVGQALCVIQRVGQVSPPCVTLPVGLVMGMEAPASAE